MSSFEIGTVELEEEKGKNQRGFKVPDICSFIQQSLFEPALWDLSLVALDSGVHNPCLSRGSKFNKEIGYRGEDEDGACGKGCGEKCSGREETRRQMVESSPLSRRREVQTSHSPEGQLVAEVEVSRWWLMDQIPAWICFIWPCQVR